MSESTLTQENASFEQIGEVLRNHQSFVLLSHVRPDGDAIGSQLALGYALIAAGKSVRMINEDGLPENLAFMAGSEKIETPPAEPLDVEVAIALDTATKPRLGDGALNAASKAKIWLNIDHHISNPKYGDLNLIDSTSPATGQILYQLIIALGLPMPAESRDAIYVAVSTDTGSFQYPSTTAITYDLAADLIRRGLDVGTPRTNRISGWWTNQESQAGQAYEATSVSSRRECVCKRASTSGNGNHRRRRYGTGKASRSCWRLADCRRQRQQRPNWALCHLGWLD